MKVSRRKLVGGAASLAAYAAMQSAEAQFNGCPPGLCPGALLGGASNYTPVNSEAAAIIAAFTAPPTNTRKQLIDTTVGALKSSGVWTELDVLYLTAAADAQAARINWKSPSSFTLVNVGSAPAFQADRGFTGDGSTSRLDTTWAASPNGVKFTMNSNSCWLWSRTDGKSTNYDIGRIGGTGQYGLRPWSTTNNQDGRNSDGGDAGVPQTTGLGFFGSARINASLKREWLNGAQVGSDLTTASATLSTGSAYICGANSTIFSTRQISAVAFGSALSGLENAFYNAIATYMTGVGVLLALFGVDGSFLQSVDGTPLLGLVTS